MLRILIPYLLLVGTIAGILYGVPELRRFGVKHRRKLVLSAVLPIAILFVIYILEVIIHE